MPSRTLVSEELASLFGVLSHPLRVRIIEELRNGEVDVNGLQAALGVTHSRVSQQLILLKAHRLVTERRDGRHVYYHLARPRIAGWILEGLDYIQAEIGQAGQTHEAVERVRTLWAQAPAGGEEFAG